MRSNDVVYLWESIRDSQHEISPWLERSKQVTVTRHTDINVYCYVKDYTISLYFLHLLVIYACLLYYTLDWYLVCSFWWKVPLVLFRIKNLYSNLNFVLIVIFYFHTKGKNLPNSKNHKDITHERSDSDVKNTLNVQQKHHQFKCLRPDYIAVCGWHCWFTVDFL